MSNDHRSPCLPVCKSCDESPDSSSRYMELCSSGDLPDALSNRGFCKPPDSLASFGMSVYQGYGGLYIGSLRSKLGLLYIKLGLLYI
jgi:hypothetical protein